MEDVRIFEHFSEVKVQVEREEYSDGSARRELIALPGGGKLLVEYDWDSNSVRFSVVDDADVRPGQTVERAINELYEVYYDGDTNVVTVYRVPTILADIYVVRHDSEYGIKIVAVSTGFADAIRQASKALNVPLDKAFANYFRKVVAELEG